MSASLASILNYEAEQQFLQCVSVSQHAVSRASIYHRSGKGPSRADLNKLLILLCQPVIHLGNLRTPWCFKDCSNLTVGCTEYLDLGNIGGKGRDQKDLMSTWSLVIMKKIATAGLQTLLKSFFPVLYYLDRKQQFIRPSAMDLFNVQSCTSTLSVIPEISACGFEQKLLIKLTPFIKKSH